MEIDMSKGFVPLALTWKDFVMPAVQDFRGNNGVDTSISDWEPSKTRQEFAEECDINTLMARYEAGGAITHVNKAMPIYMDMTDMPDLRGALDIMAAAGLAFASLPAKVRKEFDYDPQKFVDFAQTPENLDKMREWGLAPPPEAPPPPLRVVLDKPAEPAPAPFPAPPPTV